MNCALFRAFTVLLVHIETWILYHGDEKGVSKVVRDAYKNYEDLDDDVKQSNIDGNVRKIKLISLKKGEKVLYFVYFYV